MLWPSEQRGKWVCGSLSLSNGKINILHLYQTKQPLVIMHATHNNNLSPVWDWRGRRHNLFVWWMISDLKVMLCSYLRNFKNLFFFCLGNNDLGLFGIFVIAISDAPFGITPIYVELSVKKWQSLSTSCALVSCRLSTV